MPLLIERCPAVHSVAVEQHVTCDPVPRVKEGLRDAARIRCFFIRSIWSQGLGPQSGRPSAYSYRGQRLSPLAPPLPLASLESLTPPWGTTVLTVQPGKAGRSEEPIVGGGRPGSVHTGARPAPHRSHLGCREQTCLSGRPLPVFPKAQNAEQLALHLPLPSADPALT